VIPEEVFLHIAFLFGLFGVLAIAIGIVVAALIGEGEVRMIDASVLFKDTKIPLGGERKS